MRVDVILPSPKGCGDYGSDYRTYCQAVTLSNARRIAATLADQGEDVLLFKHGKTLGKLVDTFLAKPRA